MYSKVANRMERTAVLMTCYNRKEKTRKCLQTLKVQEIPGITVFLVDDGCTDGTAEMVQREFPEVRILKGTGNLFWNQGMRFAFQEAVKENFDYYIWVNDDVEFYDNVLVKMGEAYRKATSDKNKDNVIVIGYTFDENEQKVTYGGYRLVKSFVPIKLEMVQPSQHLEDCDTCNGNCVLIPSSVVNLIGVNCEIYHHSQGDIDYGLTAKRAGCDLVLTDFPVGICEKNEGARIWNDIHYRAPIKEKIKVMNGIRHRPKNEWKYFTKKFGGRRWFLRFYLPYIKIYISAFISRV